MPYRDRIITIDLDELGDGCFVTIRNPQLVPMDKLTPANVELDPVTGQPKDMAQAKAASHAVLGGLIVDWRLFDCDAADTSPEADIVLPIPTPTDLSSLDKVPGYVLGKIGKEIEVRTNPK